MPTGCTAVSKPGTELKRLLSWAFISADGCDCETRAAIMDEQGPQWCRENMDTILDWLEGEAKVRKIPFVRSVGRLFVDLAITNSLRSFEAKSVQLKNN